MFIKQTPKEAPQHTFQMKVSKKIIILPDNQIVHVIIKSYYEAEISSFRVTSCYFDQKKSKNGRHKTDFLNFLKNYFSIGIHTSISMLNIDHILTISHKQLKSYQGDKVLI